MKILAIETSCDETAIAIIDFNKKTRRVKVLANLVSSQIEIHKPFGGVVPNLARREHEANLVPVLMEALRQARLANSKSESLISKQSQNRNLKNLNKILERESTLREQFIKEILPLEVPKIDAIAVTHGPGLAPALWVGVNFARALSYIWNLPLIPVNHMEGHIVTALLPEQKQKTTSYKLKAISYPALALLVSGGHTELVLIKKLGHYKIVGETLDDAAGECFDKVARILDLPYPGGPEISKLAEKQESRIMNKELRIKLPRPMLHSKDFNFSFSGLKTAVLYLTRDLKDSYLLPEVKAAIAKEFQDAAIEVLVTKTIKAASKYKVKTIILGGGVAANKKLRSDLSKECKKNKLVCLLPEIKITGDNALMIALSAAITGKKVEPKKIEAKPNLRLN